MNLERLRIARFSTVGVLNSVVGYAVVLTGLALGWGDVLANAAGYAVGLCLSFYLNRNWTFGATSESVHRQWPLFALVFLAAYVCNLLVLLAGAHFGVRESPLLQLAAIMVYSLVFYLFSRHLVFAEGGVLADKSQTFAVLLVIPLAGATMILMRDLTVGHDVVWQFWIARQLAGGAVLYRDILEVNPPLWFWAAVLIEKAAAGLGMQPVHLLVQLIVLWSAAATVAFARLTPVETPFRTATLVAITFCALILIPMPNFGQREHLALIAALPYAALLANRVKGVPVNPWLAAAIGLAAAFGFALKHYFVVVPVLLELWLVVRRRAGWRPIRPETVVLAGAALAYGLSIALFAKGFFDVIVPMVGLAYENFRYSPISLLLSKNPVLWSLGIVGLILFRPSEPRLFSLPALQAVLIAFAGFAFSYFVQQKGWDYHALPATSLLVVAIALALLHAPRPLEAARRHPILVAALVLPIVLAALAGPYRPVTGKRTAALLESAPAGTNVAAFLVNPSLVWPAVETAKLKWSLRHFAFWMLPKISADEKARTPDPRIRKLGEEIAAQTAEDITCNPPAYIIVDDIRQSQSMQEPRFTMLEFLNRNGDFREQFKAYHPVLRDGRLTTYRRDSTTRSRQEHCRKLY